jgi:hypothetical protein
VFAQSSFEQNKVLSRNLLQLTLAEVPCFAQMKIVHNTALKMNGLYIFYLMRAQINDAKVI